MLLIEVLPTFIAPEPFHSPPPSLAAVLPVTVAAVDVDRAGAGHVQAAAVARVGARCCWPTRSDAVQRGLADVRLDAAAGADRGVLAHLVPLDDQVPRLLRMPPPEPAAPSATLSVTVAPRDGEGLPPLVEQPAAALVGCRARGGVAGDRCSSTVIVPVAEFHRPPPSAAAVLPGPGVAAMCDGALAGQVQAAAVAGARARAVVDRSVRSAGRSCPA